MVWAAWLATIGALAAFLVSLWVFIVQLLDRRRRQASMVSGWVTSIDSGRAATECVVHFTVANRSDEPVWNCLADLWFVDLSRSGSPGTPIGGTDLGVVAPGGERSVPVQCPIPTPKWQVDWVGPADFPMVLLQFVDASGLGWKRTVDGALLSMGRAGDHWWLRAVSWLHRRGLLGRRRALAPPEPESPSGE
jgi:hypothetical protein